MIVCHCNALNDAAIREHVAAGVADADELAEVCGAGLGCGSCQPIVDRLIERFSALVDTTAA